ncbi:capsid protein [Aspergillus nidulans partitivirus 1]|nr:capsid protein [Aspergillus nidulans partitivirus 1]
MAYAYNNKLEVEDSASAPVPPGKEKSSESTKPNRGKAKQSKGGNNVKTGKSSNASAGKPSSTNTKSQATGFAEGNAALLEYGLGVSGRKERILSPVKADKFFQMVEESYKVLIDAKPHAAQRFSLSEFRHASALMFYQRLENVKFDGIGVKPSAPTRIPLPRNLRVFQPLWGALANIGIVDDEELRVQYIPDGILPQSEDMSTPDDIRNLLACTLYDWTSSWDAVKKSRQNRDDYEYRDSYTTDLSTNEQPEKTPDQLIEEIAATRAYVAQLKKDLESGRRVSVNGNTYAPVFKKNAKGEDLDELDAEATTRGQKFGSIAWNEQQIEKLFKQAKEAKAKKITPRFDRTYKIDAYRVSDGVITQDLGAYGAWLHWDPQLWLDYDKFVEEVCGVAMFSQSMPVETTGTYAWLLPVESFEGAADVFCKMPKSSIPPVTWILALILQSSTLSFDQRANFYVETDRLSNVAGLRLRYIRKAISRGAPMEQYGTY